MLLLISFLKFQKTQRLQGANAAQEPPAHAVTWTPDLAMVPPRTFVAKHDVNARLGQCQSRAAFAHNIHPCTTIRKLSDFLRYGLGTHSTHSKRCTRLFFWINLIYVAPVLAWPSARPWLHHACQRCCLQLRTSRRSTAQKRCCRRGGHAWSKSARVDSASTC